MVEWYTETTAANVDCSLPGIYEWRIEEIGVYIGQYTSVTRPRRAYEVSVSRIQNGKPYRKGNPTGFRQIHRALEKAVQDGRRITLTIVENQIDKIERNRRERELIAERRRESLQGGLPVLNGRTASRAVLNSPIQLFDVVALTTDLPGKRLVRGQVGVVVESLAPAFSRSNSATTMGAPMRSSRSRIASFWFFTTTPAKPPDAVRRLLHPTNPAARLSRSLMASPRPVSGMGATAMAVGEIASAARRKAKRLAAASARSPAGLRLNTAGHSGAGPKARKASPGSGPSAFNRRGAAGA